MASLKPRIFREDILRELQEQAKSLWGNRRAEEIHESLEQTSRQLLEIRLNLPSREVEPGFYQ